MICGACDGQQKKSQVRIESEHSTSMAFDEYWDDKDKWHRHDANQVTTRYYCTNGHTWQITEVPKCPAPGCKWSPTAPVVAPSEGTDEP